MVPLSFIAFATIILLIAHKRKRNVEKCTALFRASEINGDAPLDNDFDI